MAGLRILIADDHAAVRMLLKNILESVRGWRVCGEAQDGRTAIRLATQLRPDVLVMDFGMPEINGLEAARRILLSDSQVRIVLTTLHEFPAFIDAARRAGACGCFFKIESGRHLIPAVRVAAKGSKFFTPEDLESSEARKR